MARASRKLAISYLAQHTAQRLRGDRNTELLENPLAKIDDPPPHDPVNRWDRAALEDRGKRHAMFVLQQRRLPRGLAINQPIGAMGVELEHPVANGLKRHAADLRRFGAPRPIVDRCKSQQPSRLRTILRSSRRHSKRAGVKIIPKSNCRRHSEPPSVRHGQSQFPRFGNPPS
jgi:hypothetical protein